MKHWNHLICHVFFSSRILDGFQGNEMRKFFVIIFNLLRVMQRNQTEWHKEHVLRSAPLNVLFFICFITSWAFFPLLLLFSSRALFHFLLSTFFVFYKSLSSDLFAFCSNVIKIGFRATAGMKVIQILYTKCASTSFSFTKCLFKWVEVIW